MMQGQYEAAPRRLIFSHQHGNVLRQHPVSLPLLLLGGAAGLAIISLFANTMFVVLVFLGLPVALLCVALALVLGIAGILTSIISILEMLDRRSGAAHTPHIHSIKEQGYANRN